MNEYLQYLIKANIVFVILFLFYRILLREDYDFTIRRFFLLGTVLFSVAVPFIDISSFSVTHAVRENISAEWAGFEWTRFIEPSGKSDKDNFTMLTLLNGTYWMGVIIFSIRFFYFLLRLLIVIHGSEIKKYGRIRIVLHGKKAAPFSFLKFVFVNRDIYERSDLSEIIRHEYYHYRYLHTYDLVMIELFGVICWFNPLVFSFKKSLTEVHEYAADSGVLSDGTDSISYQKLILTQVMRSLTGLFTSNFNYSLLKKRIIMINTIKKKKHTMLKSFGVLPVIVAILFAFSFSATQNIIAQTAGNFGKNTKEKTIPSIYPVEKSHITKTSGFGKRKHPITKKQQFHRGTDLAAPIGTVVVATADGRVIETGFKENAQGYYIKISHGEKYTTVYTQLSKISVNVNDNIKQGQKIGEVGSSGLSTGPHLHYEVIKDGDFVNPADYMK